MKKGLICLAAILAAFSFIATSFAADTTTVATGVSDNSFGVGTDIAVNANGVAYVSTVNNGNLQVYKNSSGSFVQDGANRSYGNGNPRLTAIALVGTDSPVVVVVGDSFVEVYFRDSSPATATGYQLQDTIHLMSAFDVAGAVGRHDSLNVTALDVAANDSFVVIVVAVSTDSDGDLDSSPTVKAFRFSVAGNNIVRRVPSTLSTIGQSDSATLLNARFVSDLQVEMSKVGATASSTLDTFAAFYVAALVQSDTDSLGNAAGNDSGIYLLRGIADSGGIRNVSSVRIVGGLSTVGETRFTDISMVVEKVSTSDTRDRVSIMAVGTANVGQETFVIWEFGGDSAENVIPGDSWALIPVDTFSAIDTGLRAITGGVVPQTISFGRDLTSLSLVFIAGGNLYRASATLSRTSAGGNVGSEATGISWSAETIGLTTGYTQNELTNGGVGGVATPPTASNRHSTLTASEELAGTVVKSTHYTVGYNDNTNQVFYLSGLGVSTGKKNSGVCLLDRMFGKTSLKAAFPALKSFRDTLLGTDFGRKMVSLYYSF